MRLAFKSSTEYKDVEEKDSLFAVKNYSDILTTNGWKNAKEITVGDTVIVDDDGVEKSVTVSSVFAMKNDILIGYTIGGGMG